ncbi:site-specific recombinase XerD [Melghirimyces profundicolus]|uniref:Site-specific recombinase XerD n=1 Tax=Melghirimyces profundicolus TaxID=1242148 RepID=A0A2T6AVI9_9BACL|nr:site-specific integrase [Melghirimyces profundicolus]PTX47840.1 site-specific recombinase XerD [Melghirimyces profundicolus]
MQMIPAGKTAAPVLPETVEQYRKQARANNTKRSYTADWNHFQGWTWNKGYTVDPAQGQGADPGMVAEYITDMANGAAGRTYKPATIRRRLVAIGNIHKTCGLPDPTKHNVVREALAGIERNKGTRQTAKKALLIEDVRAMVQHMSGDLLGVRDRALILLGYIGGFRRSELVALKMEDIQFNRRGLEVFIAGSKTDQRKEGRSIPVPYSTDPATCPVRAVQDWVQRAGIETGPLFRSVHGGKIGEKALAPRMVNHRIKRYVKAIGKDPAAYGAHSLRSGFVTQARRKGASIDKIMAQTGHKSIKMVQRYTQTIDMWEDNAAARILG